MGQLVVNVVCGCVQAKMVYKQEFFSRVLTKVLKGLKIDFSIFKALKSHKFGHSFYLRS